MSDSDVTFPSLRDFDFAPYRVYVEEFDMTDAQKRELLQTIWDIMRMFVEMGFDPPSFDQLLDPSTDEGGQ